MCFSSPKITPAREPVDRESLAAQRAYNRARSNRAAAYNEADTDIVGSLVRGGRQPAVSTQLQTLMGA